jgi:hypothetical protein
MGATRFPNGISGVNSVAVEHGVTSVTGAGTITTTLDTITGVNCSLGTALGTATTQVFTASGTAHVNTAGASTFIAKTYQGPTGAAGTVAAPVVWTAIGTKA